MREQTGTIQGSGGLALHYKTWQPAEPQGTLVLVHGTAEHVGRYEHLAAWFAARGFGVWAMEHRGHGRSEGPRVHVDRFAHYLEDLHRFVAMVTAQSGRPVMVGHSLGGLIAYSYARAYEETIGGLVLSSPWFETKVKGNPVQKALAPLLAALFPRLPLKSPIPPQYLSRTPAVVERAKVDPLMPPVITPGWYIECTRAQQACHQPMPTPSDLPILFLQAGSDQLADPQGTERIYQLTNHRKKRFVLYPEKYHEIFNDPGHEEVFAAILQWMEAESLLQPGRRPVTCD